MRVLGRPAIVEQCDLANAEDAEQATARAIERLGRVDVCVCNAGGAVRASALEVSLSDFRRIVELNLVSTFAVAARRHGRWRRAGDLDDRVGDLVPGRLARRLLGQQGGGRQSGASARERWASLSSRRCRCAGIHRERVHRRAAGDSVRTAELSAHTGRPLGA